MVISWKHIFMPFAVIGAGLLLIYLKTAQAWPRVWAMGGYFFITVGISAMLLNLAWTLPGPLGRILRHPVSNILIFLAIVVMLIATAAVGVIDQVRGVR
jgi:hypothetical protein